MVAGVAARGSPWLDQRAVLLVQLLEERHGLMITVEAAREDISSHVDLVAERMRIGRQAAKVYVTDEVIRGMADHIAAEVARLRREQGDAN